MCQWQVKIMLLDQKQELDLTLSADGLNQAKQQALKEFKKRSPQRKYLYLEAKQPASIPSFPIWMMWARPQRVDS